MSLLGGATTLIELILKKFGDDTAGAAKELERLGGFPESVSQRIATGELPMDAASVEARRIAQGYGDELYHGSTHDIKEFNGQGNPSNDWGQGTYLSDSPHDISRNYAGTHGEDFQARMYHEKEILENQYDRGTRPDLSDGDGSFDTDKGTAAARSSLQGGNEGVIYPVRVKQDGLLNTYDEVELPDYRQRALDELDYDQVAKNGNLTDEMEDEIYEMMDHLEDMDSMWVASENPNQNLFATGNEMGADMSGVSRIEEGDTWESVREGMGEASFETDEGAYVGAGGLLAEVMRKGGAKGVVDDVAPQRFPSMEAGQHTVMFPGSENQIRSVNAAYDPQYTGSNIMGNATVPLLGATALGTAGLLAAPALMKDEPFDPTAPLPAPAFGEQMGKAGEVLMTLLDLPMTGWQGIARGLSGVMDGEDVVTAGAEANHMMNGGSEEGFDRLGDKVEGLLSPIDKRFPYLNAGKSAGDTVGLLASLIAPF